MPISYQQKDDAEHAWREARENISLKVRQVANRVIDAVLADVNREFVQALHEGKVKEFDPSKEEIIQRIHDISKRALSAG